MYKKFQNFRKPKYTGNPLGWAVRNREIKQVSAQLVSDSERMCIPPAHDVQVLLNN